MPCSDACGRLYCQINKNEKEIGIELYCLETSVIPSIKSSVYIELSFDVVVKASHQACCLSSASWWLPMTLSGTCSSAEPPLPDALEVEVLLLASCNFW